MLEQTVQIVSNERDTDSYFRLVLRAPHIAPLIQPGQFAHVRVLPQVREFERILVCGRNLHAAKVFAGDLMIESSVPIEVASASECAAESDVLCTCTAASQPLFDGQLLRPGTHLNLVGTFQPHACEVDHGVITRARVVVDTYEGAQVEAGDLLLPMRAGLISPDHIASDLHHLLSRTKPGRQSQQQITAFKSVGCALEDLVAMEALARSAVFASGSR